MIEHDDVRASLELAAVEPGGLDRLAAGDTAEAAAVAGHLAGCAGCMDELTRLRRADMLLRPVFAMTPPPELRARTLEYVRAVGRERGVQAVAAPMPAFPAVVRPWRMPIAMLRPARRAAWPAAVAAALVIGLAGGFLVTSSVPGATATAAFTEVSRQSAALLAAPDAAQVVLSDAAGVARGSVVVAPSAGRMVAFAVDLPDPGAGRQYRCWVEAGGSKTLNWPMVLTGNVAWWSGPVTLPTGLGAGARFGVSLVTVGSGVPGQPVLTGGL